MFRKQRRFAYMCVFFFIIHVLLLYRNIPTILIFHLKIIRIKKKLSRERLYIAPLIKKQNQKNIYIKIQNPTCLEYCIYFLLSCCLVEFLITASPSSDIKYINLPFYFYTTGTNIRLMKMIAFAHGKPS